MAATLLGKDCVATIDLFPGLQVETILLSMTIVNILGSLNLPSRILVALSRSLGGLIVSGHWDSSARENYSTMETWRQVFDFFIEEDAYYTFHFSRLGDRRPSHDFLSRPMIRDGVYQ